MRLLFWLSALAVGYVYIGYPVLLFAWASLRPARTRRKPQAGAALPRMSIIMAVRNEAARLPARIDNLRALDSPADRLEIIVVDDGSTDDTLDVLFQHRDVLHVVASPALGKASALNLGAARATGEALVFADARQMFSPDALRALIEPLADPSIGGVT